ncbi:hypothetical protein GP486_005924 [Trichoglossum hirsutum]|uniref:Uncharacterized protein n=1 Tax=Trichoglossum hirsutum TaxID=265104 RepID=A0A9P8L8B3_9PEZI|nr:hypothetical protein GP486_005924 [Trichoglossum hirsutum]
MSNSTDASNQPESSSQLRELSELLEKRGESSQNSRRELPKRDGPQLLARLESLGPDALERMDTSFSDSEASSIIQAKGESSQRYRAQLLKSVDQHRAAALEKGHTGPEVISPKPINPKSRVSFGTGEENVGKS